jgi:hypothetical protein
MRARYGRCRISSSARRGAPWKLSGGTFSRLAGWGPDQRKRLRSFNSR